MTRSSRTETAAADARTPGAESPARPRGVPRAAAYACACAAVFFLWLAAPSGVRDERRVPASVSASEAEVDERLRMAAERALAGRAGTVLVADARTGRLRAVVGSRVAFEEAFAPGSAIKPFTMLALMRSGALEAAPRSACRGRYAREGFSITCSHPHFKAPFSAAQALAHSCNRFFARACETLGGGDFATTLGEFGFGSPTGAGGSGERSGALPRGADAFVPEMLGESLRLQVTPAQLLSAYVALFEGGRLAARPHESLMPVGGRVLRAGAGVSGRSLLIEGMRGAVIEGTAARAGLGELPLYVFGKTGTSTPREGFRQQGWFVGLAADPAWDANRGAPPQGEVGLAVLVFLRRGRGSDAAAASKPVFEEYSRAAARGRAGVEGRGVAAERGTYADTTARGGEASRAREGVVRVRLTRARQTLALGVEDYVFGVLAAEGSVETEPEALKALAVAARTYAIRNLRRHAAGGFDMCDSTHCQRFRAVGDESARPEFYELARRAVAETSGEVLRDATGRVAESYFSASCGGVTADVSTLWGAPRPPAHLRGSRDEGCAGAGDAWTDTIPADDLLRALRADARTDVGARLDGVRVARRDRTGRAELVELDGERRRTLRGWDFKIIVGRTLGWSVIKSSRFDVRREGGAYVFRGAGFGHGLGLCQAGAHTSAARGASYRQILARYMPGTTVGAARGVDGAAESASYRGVLLGRAGEGPAREAPSARPNRHPSSAAPPQARLTLSGQHFRLSYPAGVTRREAEEVMRALDAARADVAARLARASLDAAGIGRVEVVLYATTGDFTGATGQPAWAAAATRGRRIEMQPPGVLRRRGVLLTTVRHELVHVACEALGRGRAPRWLVEGLAAHVAGEGPLLARYAPARRMSVAEIERGLAANGSAEEMRALYAAAYAEVAALVSREGEAAVWLRAVRG